MEKFLLILIVIFQLYSQISGQASSVRCIPPITDRYRAVDGGAISARCTAQGNPQPTVVWTDHTRMNEYNGSSSISLQSQVETIRLFICTAENSYGVDRCFVGAYFLPNNTLYTSLLEYLNTTHSYNLSSRDYDAIQCIFSRITAKGVVGDSEVVESLLLVEKKLGNINPEFFNTYLHIFYELMCITHKTHDLYTEYNPFFGDNLYQSALILYELGSSVFDGEVSQFKEFSLYLLNSLLFLENHFEISYGEMDRMNLTEYLISQGVITVPPTTAITSPLTLASSTTTTTTTTTTTDATTTLLTSSSSPPPDPAILDKIKDFKVIEESLNFTEFENIIALITPVLAQNETLSEAIVDLTSNLIRSLKTEASAIVTTEELIKVIELFERFVSKKVNGLECPHELIRIGEENVQLFIKCIDESEISNPKKIPENVSFPNANIPESVLTQFNEQSIPICSTTYNFSLTISNDEQTTRFFSFNIPTTFQFNDSVNISFSPDFILDESARVECVFIDFVNNNTLNSSGVDLVSLDIGKNSSTIVCNTSHATPFTAIVSFNRTISDTHYKVMQVFSFILLSLSFFALVLSLILFCLAGKPFFQSLPNLVYFNYAIALTLGCSCFLFLLTTGVLNEYYCVVAVFITQYSWIAVFAWSFCICITLIIFLKDDKIRGQFKIFSLFCIFCWVGPLVPCLITLLVTIPNITENYTDYIHYKDENKNAICYLSTGSIQTTWGLIGPILFLLVLNGIGLTIFSCKLCWLMKPKSEPTFKQFKRRYLTLYIQFIILISILGLPFLFLIVNIILVKSKSEDVVLSVFEWVFLVLNAPIGVVYFFAYTIKNKQVRTLLTKNIITQSLKASSTVVSNTNSSRRVVSPVVSLPTSLPKAKKRPSNSASNVSELISPTSPIDNPVFGEEDVFLI